MIEKLYFYIGNDLDPHRNLALEEYLTDTASEGGCTLYLWQNRHTVVIGRNQNAWQECRTGALEADGGTLARRLTGGGAVYHDLGNLNFSFCLRTEDYDLARQQSVIVEACRSLGIPVEISGRNDLLTDGRKFSGNSFRSHGGCSLHNGTLLVSTDTEALGKYLTPSRAKLAGKGVASVRSRVINLTECRPDLTVERLSHAMVEAFERVYGLRAQMLREADFDAAELERRYRRFHSYEWVYGKSVPFAFSCNRRFDWGELTLQFAVENGLCADVAVWTDAMDAEFAAPLADALRACRFSVGAMCERVRSLAVCAPYASDICALLRAQEI